MPIDPTVVPKLLAAMHAAMDDLAQRAPAFHAEAAVTGLDVTPASAGPWTVVAQRGKAFQASSGRFVAPRSGHYPFMATAEPDAGLQLLRNGEVVASPLDAESSLLVAALHLHAGDIVELQVARRPDGAETVTVCWRGARV